MEIFAERLKELREAKGISQIRLSKETGLSQSGIAFWENNQRVPNAYAVIILAKYFGVTTDYLLGVANE